MQCNNPNVIKEPCSVTINSNFPCYIVLLTALLQRYTYAPISMATENAKLHYRAEIKFVTWEDIVPSKVYDHVCCA